MYKKLVAGLLSLIILTSGVFALEAPQIEAKGAIIGEMKTGEVVYELDADKKLFPASTTKLMAAVIALEYGNKTDIVTVSADAVKGLSDMGSSVFFKEGEQVAFMDMVTYLLVSSSNDSANALAEHISGSVSAFVGLMNQKAEELGCTGTNFVNPHGLHDENHYTTARDLMKIAMYAMQNEDIARIVKVDRVTMPATNMREATTISSTNHLVSRWRNRDYYYEGAIGIKTGSTTPAGLCLISGVEAGELTYITVVLGAQTKADGKQGSFTETIKLLDYAKNGFEMQALVRSTDPVTEVPVSLGKDADTVILMPETGYAALLPKGFDKSAIDVKITVEEKITAPVTKGDVLGTATYSYNGKEYVTLNLVAADSIRRALFMFIFDSFLSIFSSTFFRVLMGLAVLAVLAFLAYGLLYGRRRNRNQRSGKRRAANHRRRW